MHTEPNEEDVYIEKNFFSQDIPPEKRTAAFNGLFFHYKKDWQTSFALMLFLSVGIASLGLSEDSSATIIGAMIIAPLGQPIVAFGGAIALGWRKQSLRMLLIVVAGSIASLASSYLIGRTLPDMTPPQQILIRTSPDLRDLGIAILAGAAGAYGYYRSEFSTILSGVAIAVALVPPLCTCGLMLEQHHLILASGSLLLFVTNFTGITLAALLVFALIGLKQKRDRKWFFTGTLMIIIVCLGILIPLAFNYHKFSTGARFQSAVFEKAGSVCNRYPGSPIIKDISIQGNAAIITIDPYPRDENEASKLKLEMEQTTGLQIFMQAALKTKQDSSNSR